MKTWKLGSVQTGCLWMVFAFLAACTGPVMAQDADSGPLLTVGFSGSSLDPAWVFKLDPSLGYRFNRHFEMDGGLPVYFVHVPADSMEEGYSSKNGIGNAYVDLRVMFDRSMFGFTSEVRVTAPTGDSDSGFSSGRATVDWTNYVDFNFGKWTPFGSVGIANTVSDTHFFTRPFTSLGLVGHVEGGLAYNPVSWLSLGGSGYAVLPSGEQKIYSKLIPRGQNGAGAGSGRGRRGVFETESTVIGESELAEDRGFSGWIDLYPVSNVSFEVGYNRSISYDSHSLFFSTRFDLGQMIPRWRR